jgi:gamma-glutamylcyclotransferase (GGCT)/AIG2-like uncharacterized protein YtfP|tara:strand:+ start:252 stop:647 length:396 start_codon:yes stop_codon:yes gene_type:complete
MFLFIYGSLKRGFGNYDFMHYLETKFVVETCTLHPKYDLVGLGRFPGLIDGEYWIAGELFDLPPEKLPQLDAFEGNGRLYIRKTIPVTHEGGLKAATYFYKHPEGCVPVETFYSGTTDFPPDKVKTWVEGA